MVLAVLLVATAGDAANVAAAARATHGGRPAADSSAASAVASTKAAQAPTPSAGWPTDLQRLPKVDPASVHKNPKADRRVSAVAASESPNRPAAALD